MKRNWDTIREILTQLEELPDTDSSLDLSDFPSERAYEISYHVELLIEAGLVEGDMHRVLGRGATNFFARRMTWDGHEFLQTVRNDTVWNKTKKTFTSKGLDMTFEMVKSVASDITVALIRTASGV